MDINRFNIEGLIEIIPKKFQDERGYFFESYNQNEFKKININDNFIQDNQSFSKKGIIRGLHLQTSPFEQAKLVKVLSGKVLDVVVDIRHGSKTYGQYLMIELSSEKNNMLYIPKGFAHGFLSLEESIFTYKCSNVYNKEYEISINPLDKDLNINWDINNPIISEKDLIGMSFKDFIFKNDYLSQ
jgi:dTDP-4-dehydrorhamnose 3,5-epimerase